MDCGAAFGEDDSKNLHVSKSGEDLYNIHVCLCSCMIILNECCSVCVIVLRSYLVQLQPSLA